MAQPKILLFFEYGTLNGGEFSLLAMLEELDQAEFDFVAAARPIVATNVGGTAEILTDKISALLVPPDDIDALTAAIRQLLTNSELTERLGSQARKTAIDKFSLPRATAEVSGFWKSFL